MGLVLMGRAMFSKSLIQFSVDGWNCIPSLLCTWGQTMVKVMKIMATSFRLSHAHTAALSAPNPVAGHCQPTPPLETPGQFSSVAQSCATLCNPMKRSTPGLHVHHQLPEFTQIYIYQVSDAIQPSYPLSSPFPPAPKSSRPQFLPASESFPLSQLFA